MGSNFSRNVRELFEAAGCDGIVPLDTSQNDVDGAFSNAKDAVQHTNPRPVTPVPHHRTRMLSQDPRSPSFGILRTPIEVVATPESNKARLLKVQSDPNAAERNYLETDLDSFDDVKPEPSTPVLPTTHQLPPGLSNAHLLKLKFLGMDPRSPSEGIPRTPIQVVVPRENQSSEGISKESLDTSSISLSRSLFGSSEESLDISKACSEPSALVSDYEQSKDWSLNLGSNDLELGEPILSVDVGAASRDTDTSEESSNQSQESGESLLSETPEEVRISRDELAKEIALLAEKISKTPILPKAPAGVQIFCEDSTRTPQNTPKKKSTRTPLTPICNMTSNEVTRGKKPQGKRLDKEKLVCKVLSGCENTPSKLTATVKKVKKPIVNENANLADWDPERSIII